MLPLFCCGCCLLLLLAAAACCYLQMHEFLAAEVLHKPLVIEEFGLTWWKKTPAQQRVLFKVGGIAAACSHSNWG